MRRFQNFGVWALIVILFWLRAFKAWSKECDRRTATEAALRIAEKKVFRKYSEEQLQGKLGDQLNLAAELREGFIKSESEISGAGYGS
jgi:hypothetical protein